MALELDGDLGVDVLIIGGGIQGLYLARTLRDEYDVCLLTWPGSPTESLDSHGYFSAGYDGNDIDRIVPARRAAGYWKSWLQSIGLDHDYGTRAVAVGDGELALRSRLWSGTGLLTQTLDGPPAAFDGGTLAGEHWFALPEDSVANPASVLRRLREGLEDRIIEGELVRFGLFGDDAIDHVQVQVGEQTVPIVPRFVVLAAGAGNAGLLSMLASRFQSQAKRKAQKEQVPASQAVRRQLTICLSGDLPLESVAAGGLSVVAHPHRDGAVWLVSPAIDDAATTSGPVDFRFPVPVDQAAVAATVKGLAELSPVVAARKADLAWGVYASRKVEHPSMAVSDTSVVTQPAPARLDRFGIEEGFLALWPSHLGYASVLGDVAAERIRGALGPRGDFADGLRPQDLLADRPVPTEARWERDDFEWLDWSAFSGRYTNGG